MFCPGLWFVFGAMFSYRPLGVRLREDNVRWCMAFHHVAGARVRHIVVCDARLRFNFTDMCGVALGISGTEELVRIAENILWGWLVKCSGFVPQKAHW